jgi:chromatin structure-remodeling complex subunit RSC4
LTTLESDIKRMVTNAKSFNERSSEIFADAERIRKMLANFMPKHNIAYQDPSYAPFPTPLPGQADDVDEGLGADGNSDRELVGGKVQKLSTFVGSTPGPKKSATEGRTASSTPVVEDAEGAGESFVGDTFQVAQEKILTELIHLKGDEYVL